MRSLRPLKALRSLNSGKPRRGGERVEYTPEQTERYKSPDIRIEAAKDILARWDDLVREEPRSATLTLYRITSDRSPYGFWTVAVTDPNAFPEPDLPRIPPDEGGNGGRLGVIYAVHNGPGGSTPGLPPGLTISPGVRTVSGVDYPYATGETYAGTLVITGVGVPTIVMPENRAGRTLDQTRADEQTVWLRHSKSYLLNGTSYLVWLIRRWSGPGFDPATYDDAAAGSWWFADPLPGGYSSPLVTSAAPTPLGIANPLTPYNPGAGGGSGDPLDEDPTPPPRLPYPPDDPPGGGAFSCDCPDYVRFEYIDPESPYPSRWREREWVESKAGCAINDAGIGCKHTIAVALKLGIPLGL
jgi:hypothetical protein